MKSCTLLWKKTATQKIFCIAVISKKLIANCDAIPGKLFPEFHPQNAKKSPGIFVLSPENSHIDCHVIAYSVLQN